MPLRIPRAIQVGTPNSRSHCFSSVMGGQNFHIPFHTRSRWCCPRAGSKQSSTLLPPSSTPSLEADIKKGAPKCSKTVTNTMLNGSGGNEPSQAIISSRSHKSPPKRQIFSIRPYISRFIGHYERLFLNKRIPSGMRK